MKKSTMNEDIKEFDIFTLTPSGKLRPVTNIFSVNDYNHYSYNLHHYIKQQDWERSKQWFIDHNIKQKLFLLPINIHEQLHFQAIHNLSDEEFEAAYKISRWDLIFNRKYSKY